MVIVAMYFRYARKFLKHPNQIYIYSVIFQILDDICSIIFNVFENIYGHNSQKVTILYFPRTFFYLVYFHYILALNIEIFLKLTRTLSKLNRARINAYHILSFTASSVLTFCFVVISDFGNNSVEKGAKGNSLQHSIIMYYLVFGSFIILICMMKYVRKRFIAKSKDIINLIIISLILIATTIFGSSLGFLSHINIDERTKYDISLAADILYASIGIFQFAVLALDKKFRQKIKRITIEGSKNLIKTFRAKTLYDISTIHNDKTLTDVIIHPDDYVISQLNSGNLCEMFENMTKNSLIYVFIVISLKFLKNKRVEEKKYIHFFEIEDLQELYQAIEVKFVKRISLRSLELKEYFAEEFEYLRSVSNLKNINSSLINLQNYFKLVNLPCESGGRSDSFVYSTYDNKYVIKTIKKSEAKLFINRFLPSYLSRVHSFSSRLSRIYGAFKVYPQKQYVIIMENILYNKDQSLIYDLKGSKLDREVKNIIDPKNPPLGMVMKDINFIKLGYKFDIEDIVKQNIVESLIDDFLVLKNAGIMDYSILLGIYKETTKYEEGELNRYSMKMKNGDVVSIGVIDLLQIYNLKKFSEKTVKGVLNRKEDISSMNPEDYYVRICQFTKAIFFYE